MEIAWAVEVMVVEVLRSMLIPFRTVKFLGSSVASSTLLEGYVAVRGLETVLYQMPPTPRICIFAGVGSSTEAKGTVLMNGGRSQNYNRTEEKNMSDIIEEHYQLVSR
jgi:hypothetical protein